MVIDRELLKGSTVIVVLDAISRKTMYGYQLIKHIESESGGVFRFGEGTLYPLLKKLEDLGFLEGTWTENPGQRRRRYYRLTTLGALALEQRREEWHTFRDTVDRMVGAPR